MVDDGISGKRSSPSACGVGCFCIDAMGEQVARLPNGPDVQKESIVGRKGADMTAESGLKWFLRFISITTVPAFVAAVMPQSWVAFLIHKLDPGISIGILVTYLWRMLMLLYAVVGLQCLFFAADIRRYLPLIWVAGIGTVALAATALIALFAGVAPNHRTGLFWIVFVDFADGFAKGVVLVALLSRIPRRAPGGLGNEEITSRRQP